MKKVIPLLLAIIFLYSFTQPQEQKKTIQTDPLPSWNEGNTKQAIIMVFPGEFDKYVLISKKEPGFK